MQIDTSECVWFFVPTHGTVQVVKDAILMKFAAITAKMLRYTQVNCTEISVRHGGGNGPARRIENQLRIP